jgi:hypothetical protein
MAAKIYRNCKWINKGIKPAVPYDWAVHFGKRKRTSMASCSVNMRMGQISKTPVPVYYTYLVILFILYM